MMQKGRAKTGGRKKGSANKEKTQIALAAQLAGTTPKEYLLKVMGGDLIPVTFTEKERFEAMTRAAETVAPYIHPKLQAVQVQEVPRPIPSQPETIRGNMDLARRIAYSLHKGRMAKKALAVTIDPDGSPST